MAGGVHRPPAKKPAPKNPARKPLGIKPIGVGINIPVVHQDRVHVEHRAPAVTESYTGEGWVWSKKKGKGNEGHEEGGEHH
ncbi:MAG: hypothetical protein AABW72_00070 [archaeon]